MTLLGLAGAVAAILACASAASAEPRPLAARVLWWRGDRVYAAALDSTRLLPGTRLTILDGRKRVATAEVSDVFDRAIIAARLTSGTLARAKKLDRLRILAEPPEFAPAPLLRIGYSSAPRATAFYSCGRLGRSGSLSDRYRLADSTGSGFRLIRLPVPYDSGAPWPDTLVIRLFDDVADLEIALERGDVDAGIFWPGEASTHIRDAMRWTGDPAGIRSRGVVTISAGTDSSALASMARSAKLRADLSALDQKLFRGDLLLLDPTPPGEAPGAAATDPLWYVARGPHADVIEYFLNHVESAPPPPGPGVLSIEYRDEPPGARATPFRRDVFAIRCPIIASPASARAIDAIGADTLVNLFDCVSGRRP